MLADSPQAQFPLPMAISPGWGILFATAISLFLVPCAIGARLRGLEQRLGGKDADFIVLSSDPSPHLPEWSKSGWTAVKSST